MLTAAAALLAALSAVRVRLGEKGVAELPLHWAEPG
jgi:hypothetical protein